MKKLLAILLAMALTLGCGLAAAETSVRFVEDSTDFDIEMPLPEGATVGEKIAVGSLSMFEILKDGLATVRVTIAPSDIYDKESLADLDDEEVLALMTLAGEQYEVPEMTIDTTPLGNKYIHVCANSEFDIDSVFTLYMGYFIELTQWHDDYSTITDDDLAFMLQLLHNIEFKPL